MPIPTSRCPQRKAWYASGTRKEADAVRAKSTDSAAFIGRGSPAKVVSFQSKLMCEADDEGSITRCSPRDRHFPAGRAGHKLPPPRNAEIPSFVPCKGPMYNA